MTAHLRTAGLHNVHNAAAAGAAAFAAGIDPLAIATGLEHFAPVTGRMQRRVNLKGGLLIDDTYNANPDSVIAAIGVLADSPSPRLLVLGDMGETGSEGIAFHEEIGEAAAQCGADLFALGPLSAHAVRKGTTWPSLRRPCLVAGSSARVARFASSNYAFGACQRFAIYANGTYQSGLDSCF